MHPGRGKILLQMSHNPGSLACHGSIIYFSGRFYLNEYNETLPTQISYPHFQCLTFRGPGPALLILLPPALWEEAAAPSTMALCAIYLYHLSSSSSSFPGINCFPWHRAATIKKAWIILPALRKTLLS